MLSIEISEVGVFRCIRPTKQPRAHHLCIKALVKLVIFILSLQTVIDNLNGIYYKCLMSLRLNASSYKRK